MANSGREAGRLSAHGNVQCLNREVRFRERVSALALSVLSLFDTDRLES